MLLALERASPNTMLLAPERASVRASERASELALALGGVLACNLRTPMVLRPPSGDDHGEGNGDHGEGNVGPGE